MKLLPLKSSLNHLWLCVFLSLLWVSIVCSTTSPPSITLTATPKSGKTAAPGPEIAVSKPLLAPFDVRDIGILGQNLTSITLLWTKVDGISNYLLIFNGIKTEIPYSEKNITHTASGLESGTKYNFTLFTVLNDTRSTGKSVLAVTAPGDVEGFSADGQNDTSITLKWKKMSKIDIYTLQFNERKENISANSETYTVSGLTSATRYTFSLFAVFEYATSSGAVLNAVTAPDDVEGFSADGQNDTSITLKWKKINNIDIYTLQINERKENISANAETYTVSGLTSANRYTFSLFAMFEYATSSGAVLNAVTAPQNVEEFKSLDQNETSITLQWKEVNNISNYSLLFGESKINVTTSTEMGTHIVFSLKSGAKHNFTLFTVFEYASSSGVSITAVTVPPMVPSVNQNERSLTNVTLQWEIMNQDWGYQVQIHGNNASIESTSKASHTASYLVSRLNPGTVYNFSVITNFGGLNSTAYTDFIVTTIDCASGKWQVTNSTIEGTIKGAFTKATVSNESHDVISTSRNVLFTGLCPGTTYRVSLHYERQSKSFQQCSHKVTILPSNLKGYCEYWGSGYAARIIWDPPKGVWTTVQVNFSGKTFDINGKEDHFILHELKPAKRYKVSLGLLSGTERSAEPFEFSCLTDDRGVIAGAFFAVVLFIALVCVAVFIYLKHPEKISRKQPAGGSKQQKSKAKAIPVTTFSYHFNQLSLDENRGFSEEYEGLSSVGTDQTCKAANLPENRPKNRFTNVLPYDWCRVKLNTATSSETLDYINASYMPGYNSNREYIATQGPLPSTVKDFWRMVWEQRVNCIVMVTNCTEGGRTKCEQYWPQDSKECLYGELLVTVQSEQVESSWTLRQLTVKHNDTSEERTMKHFHFTVWPDHGVPQDTGVLIQFRQLVREHIETDGRQAPTVVHCSAGVGRTGTIIALDVLLQQLEKEQAVGINAFVHKMRLNRPYMVQTESQYVFLHQCIVDTLQLHEKTDENVYENADMIYVNATALRELR